LRELEPLELPAPLRHLHRRLPPELPLRLNQLPARSRLPLPPCDDDGRDDLRDAPTSSSTRSLLRGPQPP
jgi:hypothetical protein